MEDTKTYKCLKNSVFTNSDYSLVPVRYEDRFLIMQWRNEQIYHLRQAKLLTETEQENYFQNVVDKLFQQKQPDQILFSYLQNGECIGYGGLVRINWTDRNAEISFIINTKLEKEFFGKHWGIYLDLLEQAAFGDLDLHKIYTYAFDLRPHLYEILEAKGFVKEAVLKEHCFFDGKYKNVVIHSKVNNEISLRKINVTDKELVFEWANDELTRKNSFNSEPINFDTHSAWYNKKMNDESAVYFIGEINSQPIGLVRFDKETDSSAVIGISLDKDFRGKGLSAELLLKSCNEYLKNSRTDIFAYIKKDNIPSIKSFEKAGFVFEENLKIKNTDAVKYKFVIK